MRINAALVTALSSKPLKAYGQLARVPLKSAAARAVLRAGLPADVPRNAVVTKAEIVITTAQAITGSRTVSAQRNATSWSVSSLTWTNMPDVIGTVRTATVGALPFRGQIRIDVKEDVQAFVSGLNVNRGWRLTTDAAAQWFISGARAAAGQPYLDFEFSIPSTSPDSLSPDGGAVSVAAPTLVWPADDDQVAFQVQVDAAADAISPDFDTGERAGSESMCALSSVGYPGLALGGATSWRVRVKTDLGWSNYSDWATFSRTAKPTVTVTSPGVTTGDKTPPITWTAAGQVSWLAQLRNAAGKLLASSGLVTSAAQEWVPPRGLTKVGQQGVASVRVWDAVDRVATPGDPVWTEDTQEFSLVANSVAPGATSIAVEQVGVSPVMRVTWSAVTPDLWVPSRDGDWQDSIEGAQREWFDWYATPRTEHGWRVLARTDAGQVSPNGPTARATPYPIGVWLMDPETGEQVVVFDHEVIVNAPDQAVLHQVLDGPPVRRRVGKPPPWGTVVGSLIDTPYTEDMPVQDVAATAWSFADSDQERVYRLVWGDWNIPVTIGDVVVAPADPGTITGVEYEVSFTWWQTDDELPWDD